MGSAHLRLAPRVCTHAWMIRCAHKDADTSSDNRLKPQRHVLTPAVGTAQLCYHPRKHPQRQRTGTRKLRTAAYACDGTCARQHMHVRAVGLPWWWRGAGGAPVGVLEEG